MWYPTLIEMADIRGNQTMSRTISIIARKKSGWRPKIAKAISYEDLLMRKKQNQIATNSNHRAARAKILTLPMSQKLWTIMRGGSRVIPPNPSSRTSSLDWNEVSSP